MEPGVNVFMAFFYIFFQERKKILKIHTKNWNPPLRDDFLSELAEKCPGALFELICVLFVYIVYFYSVLSPSRQDLSRIPSNEEWHGSFLEKRELYRPVFISSLKNN